MDFAALWPWVLCALLAIACIVAGWFAFDRSHATTDQGTRWFRLLCVHDKLWGEPSSRRISADRLAGGLGLSLMDANLSTTTTPTPPFGRGWLGDSHATLVGVPEHAAARVPFAASGCGVWALPAEAPPVGTKVTGLAEQLTIPAAPGWFIGLTDSGESMLVHPIPGATFAVFGTAPQLRAMEGSMNWPEALFEVRRIGARPSDPWEGAGENPTEDTASLPGVNTGGAKTSILFVEVPASPGSRSSAHGAATSAGGISDGGGSAGLSTGLSAGGFGAAENVLRLGRERLRSLERSELATVNLRADVFIAVPPVGTGTVLLHGEHREYFNFFAITAPAPQPTPQPAVQVAPQAALARQAVSARQAPTTQTRGERSRIAAPKHRHHHRSVDGSLPLPTGERLARVVRARSASSSSAG
ncbi:hypothetical protein ACN4DP_02230 [Corynebacterium macclintockiae]|uniref:hypothetical protein n=1 Tax=Corynebacterium macclintockiae TaxID=2913501 RepID=UPI003EBC7FDA